MGDPVSVRTSGSRTEVRHCPSTRIPSPSHAAAAACLSTSGPPAFRHPPCHALPDPRARPGSLPITRDTSRHDLVATETPDSSSGSAVVPRWCGSPGRCWYAPVRALPRERGVRCLCDASTAYRCAVAAEAHGAPDGALLTTPDPPARLRRLEGGNVIAADCTTPIITPASKKRLADPLPLLARRPIWRPVTTEILRRAMSIPLPIHRH